MKRFAFFIVGTWSLVGVAQTLDIPDPNFKQLLLTQGRAAFNSEGDIYNGKVDTNEDGEIQLSEAQAVIGLKVTTNWFTTDGNITSLEGIAYFTNLKHLNCSGNSMAVLDVTMLSQLETLVCIQSGITSLNVAGLSHLREVAASSNQLTGIDLNDLPELNVLLLDDNAIPALDFSGTPALTMVYLSGNPLTSLAINGLASLALLELSDTLVETIDVSMLPVAYLRAADCPNLTSVNVQNNIISYADPDLLSFPFVFDNCPSLSTVCIDYWESSSLLYAGFDLTGSVAVMTGPDCSVPVEVTAGVEAFHRVDVSVYPNPADAYLTFESQGGKFEAVRIYDSVGKKLYDSTTPTATATRTLDIAPFQAGVYVLEAMVDGQLVRKKFLKR